MRFFTGICLVSLNIVGWTLAAHGLSGLAGGSDFMTRIVFFNCGLCAGMCSLGIMRR